jgi:hypothetical protein
MVGYGGVCYVVAAILFALAAVPFPEAYHGRLVAIGLTFLAVGHLF